MRITRKFTVRGTEPELNLWMSPSYMGDEIIIRLGASETIVGPNGHEHKAYEGKLTMSVSEAFTLISDLQKTILSGFPKK